MKRIPPRRSIDWRIQLAFYVIGWLAVILLGLSLLSETQGGCRLVWNGQQWVQTCDGGQQQIADAQGWMPFQERGWPDPTIVHLSDGGSGTIITIDGQPFILTCAHKDYRGNPFSPGDRVGFTFENGERIGAEVVAVAPIPEDVAILRIDARLNDRVKARAIATVAPSTGEKVWVVGFPLGSYAVRRTTVDGYVEDLGGSLQIAGAGIGGESGGPILNANGEVVGVLSRTDSGVTWCCPLSRIHNICNRVRARLDQLFPDRPGRLIARANPPQPPASQPPSPPTVSPAEPTPAEPPAAAEPVASAEPPPTLQPSPLEPWREGLVGIAKRIDAIDEKITHLDENKAPRSAIDTLLEKLKSVDQQINATSAWSLGKIVAATLGLSSPIGLAIVLAARFGRRKIIERIVEDRGQGGPRHEPFQEPSSSERFRHQPTVYPTN